MLMKAIAILVGLTLVIGGQTQAQTKAQSTKKNKAASVQPVALPAKKGAPTRAATSTTPAMMTGGTSSAPLMVGAPRTFTNEAMSTINYFPKSGIKVLSLYPTVTNGNSSRNFKTETQSIQTNTFTTEIGFQTRVAEKLALEVTNSFGNEDVSMTARTKGEPQNVKQNMRSSGLGDFHVIAKSLKPQGAGQLQFSADLGLSTTNSEVGSNSSDGNRSSGGVQLSPGLSYEQLYRAQVIGWKANINLKGKRSVEQRVNAAQPKSKFTVDGGNALSALAFTEWQVRRNIVGVRSGISFIGGESYEQSGQPSVSIDPYQLLTLGLYGEAAFTPKVSLVPALTFSTLLSRGTGTVDSYDALGIAVGARIAL
jgi:hypothetical protein